MHFSEVPCSAHHQYSICAYSGASIDGKLCPGMLTVAAAAAATSRREYLNPLLRCITVQ